MSWNLNSNRKYFTVGPVVWNLERINTDYFKTLDQLVDIAAKNGMFMAGVVLWC